VTIPKTRLAQLARLEGLVDEEVGVRLAELASEVEAGCIVEIGSYKGKSACYLAEGAKRGKGAHVYCVDAWHLAGNTNGRFGYAEADTLMAFHRQVGKMGFGDRITAVVGFSCQVASEWSRGPVGLLFIDGSHTFEGVSSDYLAWKRHLAPGAVVVFDDHQGPSKGVARFVNRIRQDHEWDMSIPRLAVAR
jgi:predicted O-methyltransferase YrrM